jgi:hypothetical protein
MTLTTVLVTVRVAIFREKNYSAEYETDKDFDKFRPNSACFMERITLGLPFQAIPQKIKKLEIPF